MGGGVEKFQVAADDGDGGAQLVAGIVDELPLRLICGVDSIKHSVESTSQVGDFVFADEGAAVVLVTHDLGAAAMAETALVMRDGVIVGRRCGATPDELLTVMNQAGEAA